MMLSTCQRLIIFKVLRTSGLIKEIRTNSLSIRKLIFEFATAFESHTTLLETKHCFKIDAEEAIAALMLNERQN